MLLAVELLVCLLAAVRQTLLAVLWFNQAIAFLLLINSLLGASFSLQHRPAMPQLSALASLTFMVKQYLMLVCALLLCRSQHNKGNFDENGEWIDDASDTAPSEEVEQTSTSSHSLQVLLVVPCDCVCVICLGVPLLACPSVLAFQPCLSSLTVSACSPFPPCLWHGQ